VLLPGNAGARTEFRSHSSAYPWAATKVASADNE
jgi:hypothetical protein